MPRTRCQVLVPAALLLFLVADAAGAAIFEKNGFKITGDFRARAEADFDSHRASGIPRDDRTRIRVRARVGLDYAATDVFSFGLRLRSGSDDSHQSPHITVIDFDDNDTGDADFNFDKWFLKAKGEKAWGWVGRNSLPLWKQNEMFWDDDVIPAGLALGYKTSIRDDSSFAVNAGYFSLPVGMQEFSGNLAAAQLVYAGKGFTAAVGLLDIDANPGDADATRLLRGNGLRDYSIWVGSLQGKVGKWTLGADFMHNAESYSPTVANFDQTDGLVLSVKYGGLSNKGDWLAAVYWAEIEALAVSSSYAQDDWVRWGSATETRASDMEGGELRFAYALEKNVNLVARLYLVDAITTGEDGSRFRLDFNYKF
ncbi:MAG: hypothetical protein GY719_41475 [bacterium]|nr:hypothetical protein [bacterium]